MTAFAVFVLFRWHSRIGHITLSVLGHGRALRLGSLCKPTHKRRLWELCLSGALQILDFIDWLIIYACVRLVVLPEFDRVAPANIEFNDVMFSPSSVKSVLRKLKNKVSCGLDGLSPTLFKKLAPCLAFPLSVLYNNSMSVGKLPDEWKQESPAVADKPARRLRKVCTVYVRAVGL